MPLAPSTPQADESASGLDRTTAGLLWLGLALAVLHHINHVLRVDHSGWPFRPNVTPFTFSLAAYPFLLFALFGPSRLLWVRWALVAGAAAFTLFAHTVIESPSTQFTVWAHNQSAHEPSVGNAFGVESPVLGALAVSLAMALNATAVAAALFMLRQGLRRQGRRS